nr:EamA family transporter [Jiangella rhizosphaerae]
MTPWGRTSTSGRSRAHSAWMRATRSAGLAVMGRPDDHPLYGAAIRALPAGLILLAACRRLPRGVWSWRSLVLGVLNVGAFFVLLYLAALLLPSSVAATVMAAAPAVMMLLAWALLAQRPRARQLAAAGAGLAGVALMVGAGTQAQDVRGVLASFAAMAMSSLGYVLARRWGDGVDVLSSTAWQLVAGGVVLLPFAVAVEGAPPAVDGAAVAGFASMTLVATALAFVAWFAGLVLVLGGVLLGLRTRRDRAAVVPAGDDGRTALNR